MRSCADRHNARTISIAFVSWVSDPSARVSGDISRGTSGSTPLLSRLRPLEVNQPEDWQSHPITAPNAKVGAEHVAARLLSHDRR